MRLLLLLLLAALLPAWKVGAQGHQLPSDYHSSSEIVLPQTLVVPVLVSGSHHDLTALEEVLKIASDNRLSTGHDVSAAFLWAVPSKTAKDLLFVDEVPTIDAWKPRNTDANENAIADDAKVWARTLKRVGNALAAIEQSETIHNQHQQVRVLIFGPMVDEGSTSALSKLLKQLDQLPESRARIFWTIFDSGLQADDHTAMQVFLPDGQHFETGSTVHNLIERGTPWNNGMQAHFLSKGHRVRVFDSHRQPFDPAIVLQFAFDVVKPTHDRKSRTADWLQRYTTFAEYAASVAQPVIEFHVTDGTRSFVPELIARGEPAIVRGSSVSEWSSFSRWTNFSELADRLENDVPVLKEVKVPVQGAATTWYEVSKTGAETFVKASSLPDQLPFEVKNMSTREFFELLGSQRALEHDGDGDEEQGSAYTSFLDFVATNATRAYYFGTMFSQLVDDVKPAEQLFAHEKDRSAYAQFVWISSKGLATQLHFDSDHNVFVQIVGKKRWLLFPHHQTHRLSPFPKISVKWHKSRLSMYDPPAAVLAKHPDVFEALSYARCVDLSPGDVLFIPGFYWHFVEGLSTSISLSTWSHDREIYDSMRAVYSFEHNFDRLANLPAKVAALRLAVDLVLHEIAGFGFINAYVAQFIEERFGKASDLPADQGQEFCTLHDPIPIAQYVWEDLRLDANVIAGKFVVLSHAKRRTLLFDWLEDIADSVVGHEKVVAFFLQCFRGQTYEFLSQDKAVTFWAEI